jgi:hypothetical protein
MVTWQRAGRSGFNSRQGQERDFFLFATASRPALGPTRPPTQWVPVAISLGVKRLGREADNSLADEETDERLALRGCNGSSSGVEDYVAERPL